MLSEDTCIESMVVERQQQAIDRSDVTTNIASNWVNSIGFIVNVIASLVIQSLFKTHSARRYIISTQFVDSIKEQSKLNNVVDYVSTNDILTSAFFNATSCDRGLMAINMRGRIPELLPNMAGNYENLVSFTRKEFETPSYIRRVLLAITKQIVNITPMLGMFRTLFTKVAGVSNWASFYTDVKLPLLKQIVHLPVFNVMGFDFCCIFRENIDTLVVYTSTNRGNMKMQSFLQ